MTSVLAIDQGTSSTKAVVVDGGGAVIGAGTAPVEVMFGAGGAAEADPEALLGSVVAAGRAAIADAGQPVAAVAIGNQGETVLRWDRATGAPCGPALSWQDRRAETVTRRLADRGAQLTAITGLPLDPYFAAPKLAWLQEQGGAAPGQAVTTIDAWVTSRLTGACVTDAATASRTLLLDLDAVDWSPDACAAFGLDPGGQPDIVGCAEPVGETDAFGPRLPVCGLIVDQQAALLAERCFAPGDAKCTFGTGAFVLAPTGEAPVRSTAGLAACVAWRAGGRTTYCHDGQVYAAAAAVDWLADLGLLASAPQVDAVVAGAGGGVTFVPALSGLGAPFWQPQARGAWLGLSLAATTGDLVRAVLEGVAAHVAVIVAGIAADAGQPLRRLRVDGGLARSEALLQIQADLLQVPVERYPSADATAMGIAALARLGAGLAPSLAAAAPAWEPDTVVEPRISADEAAERLARFRAAVDAVAGLEPRAAPTR